MNHTRIIFFLCLFFFQGIATEQKEIESFIVETKKSDKEKKYSEVQEDLVCALEDYLQCSTKVLHKIADSQKKTLDELRKVLENTPKMSRQRIEKELKRVASLCESLESMEFF